MTPEQLDEIKKLAEAGGVVPRTAADNAYAKALRDYALPLVKAVREARVERDEAYQERTDWMHSLDRSKADIIMLMRERDEARAEVERLRSALRLLWGEAQEDGLWTGWEGHPVSKPCRDAVEAALKEGDR